MTAVNEEPVLKVTFSEKKKAFEKCLLTLSLRDKSGSARLPQTVMDIF